NHAFGLGINEPAFRSENGDKSTFTADQTSGNVEAARLLIRNQLIKVVTGDPPRNGRIFLLNQIGVPLTQRSQETIDASGPPTFRHLPLHFIVVHPAYGHPGTVIKQYIELFDVVVYLA